MATPKQQKEYNAQLKQTKSLLADMQVSIEKSIKDSDKRNKKFLEFASINKKILGDLKGEEGATKKILQLEEKRKSVSDGISSMNVKQKKLAEKELKTIDAGIKSEQQKIQNLIQNESLQEKISEIANLRVKASKTDFGINTKHKDKLVAQLTAQEQILRNELRQQEIMTAVGKTVDDVTKSFGDQLDKVDKILEDIPLIGGFLKNLFEPLKDKGTKAATEVGNAFKSNFNSSFSEARNNGDGFFKSFNAGIKGGTEGALKMGKSIFHALGPIQTAVLLFAAAVAIGLKSFKELDAAAKSFRENTGLLLSQTGQLNRDIASTRAEFSNLGASAEDVSKAAADFSNEFSGIEQPSKAVLSSMVMLNKNFGIGTAEASKLNKVFQNLGDLSAEQSQALIGQTASMAKMAGVAPQQVIADMAESSEYAYKYFKGAPKELAKAAVQAAKMGTSIAEAGKAADNLLDFQSSISKELEASAILGVNLNLSQARYAAANGDLIGQQQAINDQVAKLGDLTKLNVFEQDALAAATGMEFSSLVNQQRIRERFGKLNQEQLAAATALVDAGKDINSITDKDLQDQTSRMARQQEMQSRIEKMQNTFKAIGVQISDAFAPFASTFIDIASILGSVLVPTFKVLGFILKTAFLPITYTFKVLKNMVDIIRTIRDDGIGGLVGKLKEMGPLMSFIVGLVTTLGVIWVATILPAVISTVVSLATGLVGALVMAIPLIISMAIGFITSAIAAISTMSALTLGIGAIAIIGGITAASAAANSSIDEGAGKVEGAIQDGVISPDGSIISTDPADFILATKDPSQLAQDVSGGGVGVDMSGVIAELQSLKGAFLSNKDVYMDKSLVTSAVTNTQERSGRENRFGLQGA
jgi:hypothetical protein